VYEVLIKLGQSVRRCGLEEERNRLSIEVPAWMFDPVLCENPAERVSPGNWPIDAVGGRVRLANLSPVGRRTMPNLTPVEQRPPFTQASDMDPLPPPLAFFLLLFSGWVNRRQNRSSAVVASRLSRAS
jgi:hypothetical protein